MRRTIPATHTLLCFEAAARLESSKAWARAFMVRHRIPSPDFEVARDLTTAEAAIRLPEHVRFRPSVRMTWCLRSSRH